MRVTPRELRRQENKILDNLEHTKGDRTFVGKLYRDGVPTPDTYLAQRVRILFVFREPNMAGGSHAHDMRDEVRDEFFRPKGLDGTRQERLATCWWNWKAGMFAHAVAAALEGESPTKAFARFAERGWNHDVVNRFAYIQIKKVGGGGTSRASEICAHAERYADTLTQQVDLYRPHLIVGGGVGKSSPARLLAKHVLVDGRERHATRSGAIWWQFPLGARPQAMVQLWHPARRGLKRELYDDVWRSVREIARSAGLPRSR